MTTANKHELLIATTNNGKIREIKNIISEFIPDIILYSLNDFQVDVPDEPYETFLENAIHKAKWYGQHTNHITLSEDSGLCIRALNNFPGVRTKEFGVDCGSLPKAFEKLETMLANHQDKTATFFAAVAIYNPVTDSVFTEIGSESGTLQFPAYGESGFGYDPIFIPQGYLQTIAELGEPIKNQISHRAKALKILLQTFYHS